MILDQLQLANGKKIDTLTGSVVREARPGAEPPLLRIPSATEAVERVTAVRKRLIDLPAPPSQMNGVAVLISYSLLGLSDEEIAIALSLTQEQVGRIKMSDVYTSVRAEIVSAILKNDTDDVRHMFVQGSKTAATAVINMISTADDEKVRLKAAQDVLDRAGHRPIDVHEHRVAVDGGLRIEYIEKKPLDVPIITIDGEGEIQ